MCGDPKGFIREQEETRAPEEQWQVSRYRHTQKLGQQVSRMNFVTQRRWTSEGKPWKVWVSIQTTRIQHL